MAHSQEPNENVRYQILHTLCDGAPRSRELEVIAAIEQVRLSFLLCCVDKFLLFL